MSSAEQMTETGTVRTVSGRDRLALGAEDRVVLVERGGVNLFVELVDGDGAPTGARRMVAALEEGAMLPLPGCGFEGMRLILVGVGVAAVRLFDDAARASLALRAPSVSSAVDRGLGALLQGLRGRAANDHAALSLVEGEPVELPAGKPVSAARPVWIERRDEDDAPTGVDLLGAGRAATVSRAGTYAAMTLSTVVDRLGWPAVEGRIAELSIAVAEDLAAQMDERRQRAAHREAADAEQVDDALRRLPSIVNDGAGRPAAPSVGGSLPPLVEAIRRVCAAQRIAFRPPSEVPELDDPEAVLQDVLRRANLRFRKIALPENWWRREGDSAVGFDAETGAPIAILRTGAGRFERVDAETGQRRPVGKAAAAKIETDAFVIFRPLPFRPLRAMDLVRHVLSGRARFDMRWAAGLAILTALLGLLPPMLIGQLLNEVVPFAEHDRLIVLALALASVAIGSALFQLVRSVALLRVEAFADGSLQAAVWDRLLRLPLTFFRRYEIGDLLIKAMGPTQLRQAISDTALSAALSAIFSLVNFGLMLTYDAKLAGAAFVFTLVTSLILLGLSRLQLRFERVQLKADAAVSSFVIQILVGIQKVRLLGAEDRAFARWMHKFSDQRQHTVRAARIGNGIQTLSAVLPILASVLFFYLVGRAEEGRLSVGSFVAFNAAFGGFHGALLGLVSAVSASLSAVPVYENMKPLLDAQPEIDSERRPAPVLDGAIHVSDVSFRYDPDGPLILDDVSLTVGPGEFVAFVGPSGSGKSTLFRLLLGFETPEQGTVGYDGLDLSRLDLKTVRRQVGVVLQRGAILPGSIFENIVGSAPLSQDEAWEAARMAGFDEDIKHMPMGMHTVLTEGGGTLSGGQRQRLMIARAVVRRPRILLMDEATSALDNRTQAIVSDSLTHLNATRIVIAHRLSTVINADRIFVVSGGRIVQSGTYRDLMEVDGPFRDLASRQIA